MSTAVRRTDLPGGLRVVTEHLPSVHSASVGVWVGVGSRDEGATVAGAAHFLEHLLFKSTPTRSAVQIAQAVDAVGGELNAFTAREHTCYYAHVLDSDVELAVDLVADVVLRGRCAAEDVEVERDVVLEEIAMRDDDPEDIVLGTQGRAISPDDEVRVLVESYPVAQQFDEWHSRLATEFATLSPELYVAALRGQANGIPFRTVNPSRIAPASGGCSTSPTVPSTPSSAPTTGRPSW